MKFPFVHLEDVLNLCDSGEWGDDPAGNEAIPVLRVADIKAGNRISYKTAPLRNISTRKRAEKTLKNGDILVVKSSGSGTSVISGRVAQVSDVEDGAYGFANFLLRLRADTNQYNPRFLLYVLGSPAIREQVLAIVGATTYPNLRIPAYRRITIPNPPLAEQERIVKLLDEADGLRKLRAQTDRRAAALIPALFHEMFGDPIDNRRGWPLCLVSSFVEELHGGRSVNPAGADEAAGRFRVLKISAVTWGEFNPKESKPVSAAYEPPESHFVQAGDLLFSRANTTELVGATSYVFDTPPNLLLPDKLWRFVWKQPQVVEPLFIWWLFQAPSVRRELGQRATGTGGSMKNISKPKVMSLEVPLPPLGLQKEFAQRAREIRELEANQATSRARLDALFQSMLHRAFNGEL
jgi:type I restriction enzyme S subunit